MPPSTFDVNWLQVHPPNGFLDVNRSNGGLRISGWIGQLSCLTMFSTSLQWRSQRGGTGGPGPLRNGQKNLLEDFVDQRVSFHVGLFYSATRYTAT